MLELGMLPARHGCDTGLLVLAVSARPRVPRARELHGGGDCWKERHENWRQRPIARRIAMTMFAETVEDALTSAVVNRERAFRAAAGPPPAGGGNLHAIRAD